ncbi:DUF2800 domain-containing protein [Aquamicrobium zhengzhouense]|uniref:DUF2800 domain-containing protein n=1 Tax=Aquamicrobium zhengzhouense TaxID=2781738 RepID=A0ABS0SA16_9HYPH|nr:DUF2800 domain-containing protein [Aquamicrobium zhengzhouense]MBI1620086.1 DUF2800 domain-containing protein [Aquamicrobium zhengzhouense]
MLHEITKAPLRLMPKDEFDELLGFKSPHYRGFIRRPSDAARWLRCHASLRFTASYPKDESSEWADEGTAAHAVREECLYWGYDAYHFIGSKQHINGRTFEVDADMADHLQQGIDEIRQFSGRMVVEYRVDTTNWVGYDEHGKPQGGTVDCAVIGQELVVLSDLKYGFDPVSPVENEQQMLYALAFYHQVVKHISKATKFLIIIDQPRIPHGGGYWYVELADLEAFGERVKDAAYKTEQEDAAFNPCVEACKWCPAANVPGRPGGCEAHANSNIAHLDLSVDKLDVEPGEPLPLPPVESLTPERLLTIHENRKAIEKFLDYCSFMALQHVLQNGPTAGKKAVLGKGGNRKWRSEGAAEAFIREQLPSSSPFNMKLKSPSQVEKEVGKKYQVPGALVERSEPKPILVPVEDAREAITPLNDEFEDYGDDEFEDYGDL